MVGSEQVRPQVEIGLGTCLGSMAISEGIQAKKTNLQNGGLRMKTMKTLFVFLLVMGIFFFKGPSPLQGGAGGYNPWDIIPINHAPRHWAEYKEGELIILFERANTNSQAILDVCPLGVLVTRMTLALKLKVAGEQRAYSQVRDVVICDEDFSGQWEELKNFINEVVIDGICGSPGVWGPREAGGNWVITKLAKPAVNPTVFMAEINIAVKCPPQITAP